MTALQNPDIGHHLAGFLVGRHCRRRRDGAHRESQHCACHRRRIFIRSLCRDDEMCAAILRRPIVVTRVEGEFRSSRFAADRRDAERDQVGAATARRSPNARCSGRPARSSQWPSMVTVQLAHCFSTAALSLSALGVAAGRCYRARIRRFGGEFWLRSINEDELIRSSNRLRRHHGGLGHRFRQLAGASCRARASVGWRWRHRSRNRRLLATAGGDRHCTEDQRPHRAFCVHQPHSHTS